MKLDVVNAGDGYNLSAAVLIYTNRVSRHAFATKHTVEATTGRPLIRPGSPFTETDYKSLVSALAPAEQPQMRWRDQRLLAQGLGRMIWWTPPQKRALFFKKSSHNAKTFDGKGICPCPGLVFMSTDRSLYLYAVKGASAPSQATALYQAPFFNVWSQGQVCVGNAHVPQEDQRDDLDAWERLFFRSEFTHPNFTQKNRLTVGADAAEFWRNQLLKPADVFPEEVLFNLKLTVGDLLAVDAINKLHGRGRAQGEF